MKRKNGNLLVPYAFGMFGMQTVITFAASFQAEFCNKMYAALDPNIITACAVILFVSKLVSCFLDPFIGVWIDSAAKNGAGLFRRVRRSILPLAVLTVLLFVFIPFDRFGGRGLMYAYITAVSVLWSVAMSLAEIPMQAMVSSLSDAGSGSRKLAAVSNFAKSMGQSAPPILVTVVMFTVDLVRGAGNTSDAAYYFVNVSVIVLVGTLFMAFFACRRPGEAVSPVRSGQPAASFGGMLRGLRENKNVRVVFLINLLGFARNMSNAVTLQANGALIGKVTLFGRVMDTTANATWVPYVFGSASAFAALFLVPAVNRRLKEKKTYILFAVLDFFFSAAAYLFYVSLRPESPLRYSNGAMYMIMTFSFIGSFLMGVNHFIPLSMTAEIANEEAARSGSGCETAPFAVLTMSVKLGTALSTVVGLWIVGASGYNQLVYEAARITPQMQNTVMLAFMAIPGVSTLLSAVPAFFYRPAPETPAALPGDLPEKTV